MELDIEKLEATIREGGPSCGMFELDGKDAFVTIFLEPSDMPDALAFTERMIKKRAARLAKEIDD